jgi:hypothetical protein
VIVMPPGMPAVSVGPPLWLSNCLPRSIRPSDSVCRQKSGFTETRLRSYVSQTLTPEGRRRGNRESGNYLWIYVRRSDGLEFSRDLERQPANQNLKCRQIFKVSQLGVQHLRSKGRIIGIASATCRG